MGVSGRASLLVHQRDVLWGQSAKKLAREDGDMPAVHGIRELVFADAGTRRGRRQWIRRKSARQGAVGP